MATLTLVNGLAGGLVATVVMTVFMMALGDDSPPPTELFRSKYVGGGEPEEYVMQGMVLHLLYGVVAGAVFVLGMEPEGPMVAMFVAFHLIYGVVLGVWLQLGLL